MEVKVSNKSTEDMHTATTAIGDTTYVQNSLQTMAMEDYLSALSSVEKVALKSVFQVVNYNKMLNVRSLSPTGQWELNIPYSRYDITGNVKISRGDYDSRDELMASLDTHTVKVYELSADMTKSITELNNLSKFGVSFQEDELKMGFQLILQKVQEMVEKGTTGEKGLFNVDASALGVNYTSKQKNIQDYDLTNMSEVQALIEKLKEWMDVVCDATKQAIKVDVIVIPLKYSSSVFNTLLNIDNHSTVITLGDLIKQQLGVSIVYANYSDDTNRILFYNKNMVEMFDVMRLQSFTNMTTDVSKKIEYVSYVKGSKIHVPIATRVTPVVFRQPKGVHIVDMNVKATNKA